MEEQYRFGHWGQTSEEILSKQFPLHRACRDGDLEALSLLLVEAQHGIYEEDNFYGWTPAHWASYFGKLNCLMRLLEGGRLDVDVSSVRLNQTSMHIAAFAGRGHNVKWLLHCGAKIDRQDYLGETALHKASRTGSMECISLLVSHGARLYIRNNSGQTAIDLTKSCGHAAATQYLEQVAQCHLAEAGGVYDHEPSAHAITTPSPHDVTTSQCVPVHQCVISQGLNAGQLPPPGPHGDAPPSTAETDSPMEEGDTASAPCPAAADGPVTDVTTHSGVSANVVSVGGRKRCLEDNDEVDHKRRRSDFSLGFNGVLTNGETNGFHQDPVVNQPWSDTSCVSAQQPAGHWPARPTFPNTTTSPQPHQHLISQNSVANGHASFPQNGYANHQSAMDINDQKLTNGHLQPSEPGVNGHGVSSWGVPLATSSMCEHRESVIVEQGYDSMLHEEMLGTRYYSHH